MPFQKINRVVNVFFILGLFALSPQSTMLGQKENPNNDDEKIQTKSSENEITIAKIIITGNKHIKKEAIESRLPYKPGSVFDELKSSIAIHNVYGLGYFRQVKLEGEMIDEKQMNLHVVVEEKKLLENLSFEGNKTLSTKLIKEKLNLEKLSTIDEETIRKIEHGLIKIYKEENKHNVSIKTEMIPSKKNRDKASVIFSVKEGPTSSIMRVFFTGNKNIPDRKLRNILFTRENWLFSFLDSAGSYQEEMLEMDKHRIEYFYRDHGYLMVKVPRAEVEYSKDKREISVTFHIQEGDQFILRSIKAPGDEMFGEEELLPLISLKEGEPYSQSKLVESMNRLRDVWGEKGYIYADVYPQVKPDENSNEVDVTFQTDRGKMLYVNRIVITGNSVTRDKVVRRQLDIVEGDLITSTKLSQSKASVEYLSFFEREGVNWKIHRISDELADLELNVQEAKTGNFNFMLSHGSDRYTAKPSLRGSIMLSKSNLFGQGYDINTMVQANKHRIQRIEASFINPHIFDSDIYGSFSFYRRWNEFEGWNSVSKSPIEKLLGGELEFGFPLTAIDNRLRLFLNLGIENIENNNPQLSANFDSIIQKQSLEILMNRTFQKGTMLWFGLSLVKDTRNHQVYPSSGYRTTVSLKASPSEINNEFSFVKAELEASCYTALIGTDSLVLALHGKLGGVSSLEPKKIIPYKELYHIGGQTTVRGFIWGGIGPASERGDPIGAQNALIFNSELIFPLIPDYSMKAHFFYDSGAGWNTPRKGLPDGAIIKRNNFNLRHTVGFGINLMKPMPAKIDWGFKLDRKKKDGESSHEFHLSMNYAW